MTDEPPAGGGPMLVYMSNKKRDAWSSREAAIEKAGKAFKTWDPRVFELWKKFGY